MMTPFGKAIQLENAGEYGKARELLEQCAAVQCHDQGEVFFHIGWCLEQDPQGDRALVVSNYEQAAAKAPTGLTRVNAFFRAGWVLLHEGQYERAEDSFRHAVSLAEQHHPDHELYRQALFWHASCLENLGQYLDAAERHRLVQRLSPTLAPESHYREIICRNQVGRYEDALTLCRAYPAQAPANFDPRRYAELYDLVKTEESLLRRCVGEDQAI
jgi:tetratricopeptide (TPR) repeat protein